MAEVLVKCGVKRAEGWLYFIDKKGNVARVKMARKGVKTSKKQEVVYKAGVKRVVYSASSSAYGDQDKMPLIETMTPNPM